MGKMVEVGNGIRVNASAVSFIEDDVVVLKNKHRYTVNENALKVIKAELSANELREGEILETVCKLFADGFEGNKTIKVTGSGVTYNTDAVNVGDYYCVSYRDGGFFVGLRESEDYEPKEGDWWCYSQIYSPNTIFVSSDATRKFRAFTSSGYPSFFNNDLGNLYSLCYINKVGLAEGNKNGLKDFRLNPIVAALNEVGLFCVNTSVTGCQLWENNSKGIKNGVDVYINAFKQITPSDIIAYQATGKMGQLFISDIKIDEGTSVANKVLCSNASIIVDGREQDTKRVGSLYITKTPVSGTVTGDGDIFELLKDNTSN